MKLPRKNPQDGGENDDDRKPAAKDGGAGRFNDDEHDPQQQHPDGHSEAGDSRASTDVASVPSSWASPVARAPSNNSLQRRQQQQSYRTPQQNKSSSNNNNYNKKAPKTAPPGLAVATPYTLQQNDDDALMKPDPVGLNQSPNDAVIATTQQSLQTLQRQFILWMGTAAIGIAVLLYEVLPTAALAALLFVVASTGMLSQSVYWTARQWYRDTVLAGPGLAGLLPASLRELLTQTSLNDYLTDPTFTREYRHLVLYFLPLSEAQLEAALQQLAPAHRERLLRPGLAHLLPAPVERLLFGAPQQAQPAPPTSSTSNRATIDLDDYDDDDGAMEVPVVRRQLLLYEDSDDDESDLGLDVSSDDLTGGLSDNQADMVARRLGLQHGLAENNNTPVRPSPAVARGTAPRGDSNSNNDSNNNNPIDEDEANRELDVLINALWESAYGMVWNPVRDAIVVPSVSLVRRVAAWSAILGASGYGLWFWSSTLTGLPPIGLWLQQTVQSTLTPLWRNGSRTLQSVSTAVAPGRDRQPRTWSELSNASASTRSSSSSSSNLWMVGGAATSVVGLALYYARRNYYYSNGNHVRQIGSTEEEDAKED